MPSEKPRNRISNTRKVVGEIGGMLGGGRETSFLITDQMAYSPFIFPESFKTLPAPPQGSRGHPTETVSSLPPAVASKSTASSSKVEAAGKSSSSDRIPMSTGAGFKGPMAGDLDEWVLSNTSKHVRPFRFRSVDWKVPRRGKAQIDPEAMCRNEHCSSSVGPTPYCVVIDGGEGTHFKEVCCERCFSYFTEHHVAWSEEPPKKRLKME